MVLARLVLLEEPRSTPALPSFGHPAGRPQTEGADKSQQVACGVDAGLEELSSPLALLCGLLGQVAALLIKEQHHADAHSCKQLPRKASG